MERYYLTFSIVMWKTLRQYGFYDWTDEELENAKDGFIGTKNGVDCYILPLFNSQENK